MRILPNELNCASIRDLTPATGFAPSMKSLFRFEMSGIALLCFFLVAVSSQAQTASTKSVMETLPKFTADVPEIGPEEQPATQSEPTRFPAPELSRPGNGLAQHPLLFIGEGCNKMFVINNGKIIWTYSTGQGGEYDDAWLLSNGNILFSRMGWAGEVTPQKKLVWRYNCAPGTEVHTLQPLGLDKVFIVQNGTPAKMMIIEKATGKVVMEHEIPEVAGESVHGQFRRARVTAQGTYLFCCLEGHKVIEYDKDFKLIWTYPTPQPWAAIRLPNGNTLISDEVKQTTVEVTPKGDVVWKCDLQADLPPELYFVKCQTCVRLANGNTIFCSHGGQKKESPQLVEITPEKKVVWVLDDWTDLGPATAIQVLDDPGVPEVPGDCLR